MSWLGRQLVVVIFAAVWGGTWAHAAVTTVALVNSDSIVFGQTAMLGANIAVAVADAHAGVPSGTVQFFEGVTPVGAPPTVTFLPAPCLGTGTCPDPVSIAFATLAVSNLSVGVHTITAVYSGDPLFAPSTSAPFTVTVNPVGARTPTTTIAPSSTIVFGQAASLSANVVVALADYNNLGATGTVQFFEGSTAVSSPLTLTLAPPSCVFTQTCTGPVSIGAVPFFRLNNLSVGVHTFTAVYSGDPLFAPSTSAPFTVTVNPVGARTPTTTIAPSSTIVFGQAASLSANVVVALADYNNLAATGTVQFFEGSTAVSSALTLSLAPPSCAFTQTCTGPVSVGVVPFFHLNNLSVGVHTFTAVYSGEPLFTPSTSAPFTVTVNPVGARTPTTTIAPSSTIVFGQAASLSANVAVAVADYNNLGASGTVQFLEGSTAVSSPLTLGLAPPSCAFTQTCTGPVSIGAVLFFQLNNLSVGVHTFTAVYSGDPLFAPSTSAPFTVTVNPVGARTPTTTIASSSTIVFGQAASLGANVAVAVADYNNLGASGTVQFFEGSTAVSSALTLTLAPPSCVFTQTCTGPVSIGVVPFFQLNNLSVGVHTFTAVYSGDPLFAPSTSAPFTVTVQAGPITTGRSFGGPTATASGTGTVTMTGGGALCGFTQGRFVPVAGGAGSPPSGSAPAGVVFPDGLIDFATSGCTPGSTLVFTISLPRAVDPGTQYWKYGPTPGTPSPHWYTIPASINGNVITFSITDGSVGDDDLTVNGTVVDQGGPGISSSIAPIPTVGRELLLALSALLAASAFVKLRRRLSSSTRA